MAFITLSGTLLDPTSELAVGDQVRFTHKSTTGETVQSAVSLLTIPPTGDYSIDLQYGLVLVEYKDVRKSQFKNLGVATVNQDNPATSIPELLNALVPVSSAELIEFQAILADCVAAQLAAEAAQLAAENAATTAEAFAYQLTTVDLIASTAIFTTDTNIPTSGFTTSGDGGGCSWVQNGITGQTPSQSPTQLSNNLINDANGNQWALVVGQVLDYNGVQWFPSPFGDSGNGGYLFDTNGWVYISLINDLSQSYTFPTVTAYKTSTILFPVGKNIHLDDRNTDFKVINGTGTSNDIDIIGSTEVSQSASIIKTAIMYPEQYGVIGGGADVTNDTLAFQLYIDDRSVAYLGSDSTYEIDTLTLHSNIIIQGDPSSKIKCHNTINPSSLENIKLFNTNFEYGEDSPNGLTILTFTACNDIWIDKCIIDGLGYSGSTPLVTGANTGLDFLNCNEAKITNNTIKNMKNNWGIHLIGCINFDINKNFISNTGRAGIEVFSGNSAIRVTFNNLFNVKSNHVNVDAFDGCIDLYGPSNEEILIQGNRIKNGGGTGANFSGDPVPATGIRVSGSTDVDVCDNIVVTGDGMWAVYVNQARDGVVSSGVHFHHNQTVITGPVQYCFRHTLGTNISFDYNTSRADDVTGLYQTNCIEFRNEGENISVKGNVFDGYENGLATVDGIVGLFFHNSGTLFSNITVTDNIFKVDSTAVFLHHCDMFTVSDNIIEYDQSAAGINAPSTSSNGIISSNCVKRSINPNIVIDAGATNVSQANNILAVAAVP